MSDEVNFRTPTYRVRRGRGLDPATRRLALIAAGLGSALLAVVGAWSITGHHHGAVPVIAPPSGPMRVKPENPGGMQLTASQELFAATHADDTDQGKLAPPPEIPDPQALRPPPKPAAPAAAVTAAADAGEL
ncbi:MAG TPA: hypothetical protein VFW75_02930, partial [Acetobacteraceae bacterium]|nr:hypothetical protein [Acetobacteraceae bacterium]